MKHIILICGYGSGISHAVACHFAKKGHPVALVARNTDRLAAAKIELTTAGFEVRTFSADLNDVDTMKRIVTDVQAELGPIGILHWNAFLDIDGDLLSLSPLYLSQSFEIRVTSYISTVQACLDSLKATKGSVLVTSGIMALDNPQIDAFSTEYAALAISVAAQHKATGILVHTLSPYGIYVGEVIVNGFIAGTPGGVGKQNTILPIDIAEQFWQLYTTRQTHSIIYGNTIPL